MDYYGKAKVIVYYFLFLNLGAFLAFALDKDRSRKNKWRISEKSLLTLTIIGGSIGSLIGMYFFKHKTQKKLFTVGVPVILFLQVVLLVTFYFKSEI